MANLTPQQIEDFLQEFFDVVGTRQYTGARYVPIFGRAGSDTVEWDDLAPYEPLTVVMHEGVSYVSRRYVPRGIQITDTDYWVETYRYNAQVEQYRQEVLGFQDEIDANAQAIENAKGDLRDELVPFPNPDTYPKYGLVGQVLSTMADGTTKWDDPVTVDADVAEPLIDAWLTAHPEATTTVEDNSITNVKIQDDTITDAKLVQEGGILETVAGMQEDLSDSGYVTYEDFTGAVDGYYISYQGVIMANESYAYTQPIAVKAGQRIRFIATGYQQQVAMVSRYEGGAYTTLVRSADSSQQIYAYNVTEDMQVVLCYRTGSRHVCAIVYGLDNILDVTDELLVRTSSLESGNEVLRYDFADAVTGYYIADSGNVIENGSYSYSQPISVVAGMSVALKATGYSHNVAMISKYEEGTYTALVVSTDSSEHTYTYDVTQNMQIVLSYRTQNTHECDITVNIISQIDSMSNDIDYLTKTENTLNYACLFSLIGGVGDSLMSGELVPSNLPARDTYSVSWLSQLAKVGSCEAAHFSAGGMTTKAWVSDSGGYRTALENAQDACDIYFIGLGTNDKNQSEYPLGNLSDTSGTDSFVGYYKQIIEIIHAKNPNAKVFCLSMYDRLDASVPYSSMVSQISRQYNYCYFIDFANNTKHTPKTDDQYAKNSHFTAIGYLYASKLINKLMCKAIEADPWPFRWEQYE